MKRNNAIPENEDKNKQKNLKESLMDNEIIYEFGGPIGAMGLILFSHFIMIYLWVSLEFHDGNVFYPSGFMDIWPWLVRIFRLWIQFALPTVESVKIYGTFILIEVLLAIVIPGLKIKGLPVPSENGKQLEYNCNAIHSWYIILALVAFLQYFKFWSLASVIDNFAPLITTAILAANILSVILYISAFLTNKTHRMSGNHIYDFFMGASLNPRFFNIDLKMWAEVRVSWALLFFLTLSAAVKQYETIGEISGEMFIVVLAHFLYANACHKGEHCIPTTWDIFYEKWGWMIIYWNLAGVPFVYSFQSRFILKHHPIGNGALLNAFLIILLLIAYYVFDTANAQKNQFRMIEYGTYIKRNTFPQLPWGVLENPRHLNTEHGNKLLIDGWYRYARKIHYTADTLMALIWGLSCGYDHFLPFFYVCFFTGMIFHRYLRDQHRCKKKYGKDWERYCEIVPYVFIPFIY
jgi:delta24(24(1))-sterol reductase